MDSRDGLSSSAERSRELILSVTLVFTGRRLFLNKQDFWLVLTDKRIIFFNTNDILTASGKSPTDLTLQDRIRRLVIPEETSLATRETIRSMHPSAITAAYPGAMVIPVSAVARFAIDQGYADVLPGNWDRLKLEITRRDKTGRETMFRFTVEEFPAGIISAAKKLFRKKFVAPKVLYHGMTFWHRYEV